MTIAKKQLKKVAFVLTVLAGVLAGVTLKAPVAYGVGYVLLEPSLPGIGYAITAPTGQELLGKYADDVFVIMIGAVIVSAFGHLIIQYFINKWRIENGMAKDNGPITASWIAIGLSLGAYLLLATLSPDLINFQNFSLLVATAPTPTGSGGGPGTGGPTTGPAGPGLSEAQARDELLHGFPPIAINHGPCVGTATTGCTNVAGFTEQMIQNLRALAVACSCAVEVTGGTEPGHQEHNGNAVDVYSTVDPQDLSRYINQNTVPAVKTGGDPTRRCDANGTWFYWEPAGTNGSSGPHWHIGYNATTHCP